MHSDQGFQYTHKLYHNQLEKLQLHGSHSRKGNCLDNACVKSFFSHLKAEVFLGKSVQSKEEASTQVEEYIRFYNTERFQKRLGQLSTVEYREKTGRLIRLYLKDGALLTVYLTGYRPPSGGGGYIQKGLALLQALTFLVPGARLELARGCPRRILSPLRLPIPPSRQTDQGTWAMPHMHDVSGFVAQGAPIRQALSAVVSLIGQKQLGNAARQRSRMACPIFDLEPI